MVIASVSGHCRYYEIRHKIVIVGDTYCCCCSGSSRCYRGKYTSTAITSDRHPRWYMCPRYHHPDEIVVNVVISDDAFNTSSVSKKGIANNVVVTTALVAVDLVALVEDATVLAKDVHVAIVEKALGIQIPLDQARMVHVLSSKKDVALVV